MPDMSGEEGQGFNWLEMLRMMGVFGQDGYFDNQQQQRLPPPTNQPTPTMIPPGGSMSQPIPMGNDLPSQGGISGNMFGQTSGGMFNPKRPNPYERLDFGAGTEQPDSTANSISQAINPILAALAQGKEQPTESPMSVPMMGPSQTPSDRIGDRMKELYQPSTEASDRFEKMQSEYPKYEKPGWGRTIAAMLSDYAYGPEMGMKVANFHNDRRMTDWKNQIGPAQQSANLERQENVNARTTAYQTISQELRAEADAATMKKNDAAALVAKQRADAYEYKMKNPGLKFDFSGPMVMVTNPATGKVERLNIPTGSMTDADKMALSQEQALERIGATGSQARQTEGVRQENRQETAETRGWTIANIPDPAKPGQMKGVKINAITGEVKDLNTGPVSNTSGGSTRLKPDELPSQTKIREYTNARRLFNTNPKLAKFITFGPGTNEFNISPPSSGGWGRTVGPTPEETTAIQKAIYGDTIPISQPGRTNTQSSDPNKVKVISPTGQPGFIPKSQLQAAQAQGYKLVQ